MGRFEFDQTQQVTVNISPKALALNFGDANSVLQAQFFNELAKYWNSWEGDKDGMQMLSIKDDLTPEGKALIEKLHKYFNLED